MRIGLISDTHNFHTNRWKCKQCDIIIHSGDFSFQGKQSEINQFLNDAMKAKKDCGAKYFIVVPGNHEKGVQKDEALFKELCKDAGIICLIHEEIEIEDIKIFGTPFQPYFCNWAYNIQESKDLKEKYDQIPKETEILISHCPPWEILDYSPMCGSVGSKELLNSINKVKPKLITFGHIHFSNGSKFKDGMLFVNSALCDDQYNATFGMKIVVKKKNSYIME